MAKPRIFSYVLLLLMIFITVTSVVIGSVNSTIVSMQWGHLYPSPSQGEQDAESWVCTQINSNFYGEGWATQNALLDYTQLGYVFQTLQYCQNPNNSVTWATTWWVGDFLPDGNVPHVHRGFYGHNSQHIFDDDVYAFANYLYWPPPYGWWQSVPSKQYFDFIWTCANGGIYFDANGNTWNVSGVTFPDTSDTEPPNPLTVHSRSMVMLKIHIPRLLRL